MRRARLALLLPLCLLAALAHAADDNRFLDVSIQAFTHADAPAPKAADDDTTRKPEPVEAVRTTETRLLPMYLRFRLEQSAAFGAVRVVPQPDQGAELRITGQIVKSDGTVLELAVTAEDSSGRVWFDRHFQGKAVPVRTLNNDTLAQDDFAGVFGEIVAALKQQSQQLDAAQIERLHNVALLRYGLGLVPDAFRPYLDTGQDGAMTVKRLPASDDPILRRILVIRDREYQFIDVVDEEYRRFYAKTYPLYTLWRQSQREQAESTSTRNAQALANAGGFQRGSYRALVQSYNNYRWTKLQELYVDELGEGFTNEVEPTQVQLNDSMYRLTGTLDQQYREWRTILQQLFELENGGK